jgi:hypothetical protein
MNMKCLRAGLASILVSGLVSGCVATIQTNGPAPVVVETVPDSYVWDGTEYVGVIGGQYMYLGPGEVWLVCEPFRLERFHGWERVHPDWRREAIRNERFRKDRYGHVQPRNEQRGRSEPQKAAPRVEPKAEPQKAAPKAEQRAEPQKAAPKVEPKAAPQKAAPKVEPKAAPKAEPQKAAPKKKEDK